MLILCLIDIVDLPWIFTANIIRESNLSVSNETSDLRLLLCAKSVKPNHAG